MSNKKNNAGKSAIKAYDIGSQITAGRMLEIIGLETNGLSLGVTGRTGLIAWIASCLRIRPREQSGVEVEQQTQQSRAGVVVLRLELTRTVHPPPSPQTLEQMQQLVKANGWKLLQ